MMLFLYCCYLVVNDGKDIVRVLFCRKMSMVTIMTVQFDGCASMKLVKESYVIIGRLYLRFRFELWGARENNYNVLLGQGYTWHTPGIHLTYT